MCISKRTKDINKNEALKKEDEIQVDLLKQIIELAKTEKEMYISTVQRKCNVGYIKAFNHIEHLVQNNILTKIESNIPKYVININNKEIKYHDKSINRSLS